MPKRVPQLSDKQIKDAKIPPVKQYSLGFYPEFTDTSKKPIVAKRSVYAEEKKIQPRV